MDYYNFLVDDICNFLDFNYYGKIVIDKKDLQSKVEETKYEELKRKLSLIIRELMLYKQNHDLTNTISYLQMTESEILKCKELEKLLLINKKISLNNGKDMFGMPVLSKNIENILDINSKRIQKIMIENGFVNRFDFDLFSLTFNKILQIRLFFFIFRLFSYYLERNDDEYCELNIEFYNKIKELYDLYVSNNLDTSDLWKIKFN